MYREEPPLINCIILGKEEPSLSVRSAESIRKHKWTCFGMMQLIKGGSSRYINQKLGRKGPLWARDYFDRYMRSEQDLDNKIDYLLQNPVQAGLVNHWRDWPWTDCFMDRLLLS
jgi:hypothetical protein